MPGLPREVVEHHLVVCQSAWLVEHKERYQVPEKQEIVTPKVNKPLEDEIALTSTHPEWIITPSPITKPCRSGRMCI